MLLYRDGTRYGNSGCLYRHTDQSNSSCTVSCRIGYPVNEIADGRFLIKDSCALLGDYYLHILKFGLAIGICELLSAAFPFADIVPDVAVFVISRLLRRNMFQIMSESSSHRILCFDHVLACGVTEKLSAYGTFPVSDIAVFRTGRIFCSNLGQFMLIMRHGRAEIRHSRRSPRRLCLAGF